MTAVPPPPSGKDYISKLFGEESKDLQIGSYTEHEGDKKTLTFTVTLGTRAWNITVGDEAVFTGIKDGSTNPDDVKKWAVSISKLIVKLGEERSKSIKQLTFVPGTGDNDGYLFIGNQPYQLDKLDDLKTQHKESTNTQAKLNANIKAIEERQQSLTKEIHVSQTELDKLPRWLLLNPEQKANKARWEKEIKTKNEEIQKLHEQLSKDRDDLKKVEKKIHLDEIAKLVFQFARGLEIFEEDSGAPGTVITAVHDVPDPHAVPPSPTDASDAATPPST